MQKKYAGHHFSTFKVGIDADMTFHNTFLRFLSAIALLGFSNQTVYSQETDLLATGSKSQIALSKAKTPSDSIRILLDVYRISDKLQRDRVRVQLINLTQRSDNQEVINDVLTQLSTSTDDTKDLARLIEISENLPDDTTRDNLQTVLIMEQAQADASTATDSQLHNEVAEYARLGMAVGTDPYKEIQNIYRAMMYLGASSQGPLYFEYIKRLQELVDALPEEDHAIKNLYYTTAAIFYTRKRDYKKAVEFDRKLIEQLDQLKTHYSDQEKAKQDLDYFYYVSYRRMLRNYRALTPEQIEQVYNECLRLVNENQQAAEEFGTGGLTNSYYYMATAQYAKAIPELKKAISNPDISTFRKQELLGHLAYAQLQTGDEKGELETLRTYARMLVKERNQRRDDMYREIELRNSVSNLMTQEYKNQLHQREENRTMRKTSLTLVYVLAVALIFLCQAYFRLRSRVKDLEKRNTKLHRNIEHIFDDGIPSGTTDLLHHGKGLKG